VPNRLRPKLPLLGGTVIISIVETRRPAQSSMGPTRTPQKRAIARLQQKTKLGGAKASDEVEGLGFMVRWEPTKGALGVLIPLEQLVLPEDALQIVS
jgi:mediator of RNA polymerase II transcription subunit 14